MQQSGHIGKIVIRPPKAGTIMRRHGQPFTVSAEGVHLITGGLGGFGLETARWLADRGAKHLVLVGRKGAATDEAKAIVAELDRAGRDRRGRGRRHHQPRVGGPPARGDRAGRARSSPA